MPKVAVAEWILSLVVAPDRAATTVGDLVEDASTRRVVWFWSSVLWTALSHLWRDLSASPFRMVRLAFWGWLAQISLLSLIAVPLLLWQLIAEGPLVIPPWINSTLTIGLGIILLPFLVGWAVAHDSRGKELAGAFALNVVSAAIHFVFVYLSARQMQRIGQPYPSVENSVITLWIRPPFVFAGAIAFRWLVGSRRMRVTEGN
jgi:hypothetical protein